VLSRGTRTPDIQEQRSNWTYAVTDFDPPLNGSTIGRFYQSGVSPGGLRSERITSRELGYLLREPRVGLLMDARVFDDELKDLISEKLQVSGFLPTNNNSVRLRGAELQVNLAPSDRWNVFFNYAYLRNQHASTPLERTQYSRHSGAVGITQDFGDGWRWSLAYYGSSGDGLGENYYGREDLTLARTFNLQTARVTASLIVRRLDNRAVTYFRDIGDVLKSEYDDRLQVYGYLRVAF
jgi:iron complex outermembrane recepter protein